MSKRIIGICLRGGIVCAAYLYTSWLFFAPIFWTLTGPVKSFEEGLQQVFARSDGHGLLIGGGIDLIGTLWIFSNAKSIFEGEHGTILSEVYAPIGFDLGKNTGFAWADAALSWPLMSFLEGSSFYNAHVLLTLFLSQVGVYVFLRAWKTPFWIALPLASFVIFNPFVIQEVFQGRPTQVHLVFHGLFLLCIAKIAQKGHWVWSLFGGFFLAASCLVYWFSGAAIGFCGILLILLCSQNLRKSITRLLLLGCVSLLMILPITWRVSSLFLSGTGASSFAQIRRQPIAEIELFPRSIPIQNWLYTSTWSDVWIYLQGLLPSMILWLAIFSLLIVRNRFRVALLLLIAVSLPIEGALVLPNQWWFPTGYAFLQTIFPPLTRCTVPERMMVAGLFITFFVIALGLTRIVRMGKSVISRSFLSFALGSILVVLALQGKPQKDNGNYSRHHIDKSYLSYTKKYPGGLIDVPLIASEKTYVQQRYHKQKIIGGPGQDSVRPFSHRRYYQRNTLLKGLERLAEHGKTRSVRELDRKQLWNDGFRLVVVHMNLSKATQASYEELIGAKGELDTRKNRLYIALPNPNQ